MHAKSLHSCLTLCLAPGDLPDPGIEPTPLMSPALAGRFFTTSATWEAQGLVQPGAETPSGRNRPEKAPSPGWLRLLGLGPPLCS